MLLTSSPAAWLLEQRRRQEQNDSGLEAVCFVAVLHLCLAGGIAGESLRDKVRKCVAVAER